MQVKKTLYWREGEPPHGEDEATTDTSEVMLEPIWGCTILQLRQAARVAASHGFRLFLLSYARQRLLANEGLMVRELGGWCPFAFRSFQLDVHTTMPRDSSTHFSSISLLEEAQRGFAAQAGVDAGTQGRSGAASVTDDFEAPAWAECAFPFAVAEAIVDVKRDALVPWAQVCDNPLTACLFAALYDRRHFCVMDAVLYASQRVVLPFLLGLPSTAGPLSLEATTGTGGGAGTATSVGLMRWSEIHAVLRWRFFELPFGSLSQLVRTEDVAAVGGGLDPFILPLHDTFVTRVLMPRMTDYYHATCRAAGASSRMGAPTPGDKCAHVTPSAPATVTVDILSCFNGLVGRRGHRGVGSSDAGANDDDGGGAVKQQNNKNGRTPKAMVDAPNFDSRRGDVHFMLSDLPSLVKYLLYFHQHFEVQDGGTAVTFTPHEG
ncbi:hypothetical protein TraAM80_01633 [Trypanosoma rangeli]|uniref:Uncharacterized protein n=1 Tax=Trypanosoma rangeli TaxID=5698 RepID=A0A3R7M760_TRYRA|nr:uncharacterized protein TraAM80_01633 [Trypanosoma rangeli]RNF10290.1 hypothetical protein TraAM80_01633 [Trypanosoma rangeli]|eukprot:RNF10290.1 hypothetical protein TraAM80_01633 [Trypanosoma rangeli]